MKTKYLFLAIAVMLVFSCGKSPLDPTPEPEPEEVTAYYSINGVKSEIKSVGLYKNESCAGYNLVLSNEEVDLCGGYDRIGNRSVSLLSVDFAEITVGESVIIGVDEISSPDWDFYVATWDSGKYEESFLKNPVSGSYTIEFEGESIKIALSVAFEGGAEYEVNYSGAYSVADKYIWCEMLDTSSSFLVDGQCYMGPDAQLYYDEDNHGYELRVKMETKSLVVDFSDFLIGKKSVVGVDDLNPKADDNSMWAFLVSTIDDGKRVDYVDLDQAFQSGYLDCHSLTDERVDIDLAVVTEGGRQIEVHHHDNYSVSAKPNYVKRQRKTNK